MLKICTSSYAKQLHQRQLDWFGLVFWRHFNSSSKRGWNEVRCSKLRRRPYPIPKRGMLWLIFSLEYRFSASLRLNTRISPAVGTEEASWMKKWNVLTKLKLSSCSWFDFCLTKKQKNKTKNTPMWYIKYEFLNKHSQNWLGQINKQEWWMV